MRVEDACGAMMPLYDVPCLLDPGHDGMHHFCEGGGMSIQWSDELQRLIGRDR